MSRCVNALLATAFSLVAATSANAQSNKRWNGPYIGANLGHAWADVDGEVSATNPKLGPASFGFEADGAFVGIQAGYNKRLGNFFVGVEADLQTADISGSTSGTIPGLTASASIDWFGTARVRSGYATDALLVYATAGVAFGGIQYDASFKTSKGTATLSSDDTQVGFVLGAGVEFALRSNWSLKIEYQYLNFGSQGASDSFSWSTTDYINCRRVTTTHTNTVTADLDPDIHTIRVGLNYAFDAPPPRRHQPLKP
jgi:outer membrane immunogenic protein